VQKDRFHNPLFTFGVFTGHKVEVSGDQALRHSAASAIRRQARYGLLATTARPRVSARTSNPFAAHQFLHGETKEQPGLRSVSRTKGTQLCAFRGGEALCCVATAEQQQQRSAPGDSSLAHRIRPSHARVQRAHDSGKHQSTISLALTPITCVRRCRQDRARGVVTD
jgi:hypothetical protein